MMALLHMKRPNAYYIKVHNDRLGENYYSTKITT